MVLTVRFLRHLLCSQDVRDSRCQTLLMSACVGGNVACVELVLNAKASIDARDSNGRTALMTSAEMVCLTGRKGFACVSIFFFWVLVEKDLRDCVNFFIWFLALHRPQGKVEVVRALLKHKANHLAQDYLQNNALMLACTTGHYECVDVLTEQLADSAHPKKGAAPRRRVFPSECGLNEVNREGLSPLALAACTGNARLIELLIQRGAKVGWLAEKCSSRASSQLLVHFHPSLASCQK